MTENDKIGFIDEDVQWINQFKRFASDRFDVLTFELSEETTIEKLIIEIRNSSIDCLIVDFDLKESDLIPFNGDDIIDAIRKDTPFFPLFVVTCHPEEHVLNEVDDVDIVYVKENITDPKKQGIFALRIKNKIDHYRSKIRSTKQDIERLVLLKAERALTPMEEEQLAEHYYFLEKTAPEEKILPAHLAKPESISQLNSFVENTKKILEELKKQK